MTKLLILFTLLFLNLPIFCQHKQALIKNKKDHIIRQIDEINSLLGYYRTLSPFSDDENRFDLIDSIGRNITARLLKLLNDNRIINYPLETLFDQNEIVISKSKDNKIFFFSIEEKSGGSYRRNITIIHYRPANGKVKAELFSGDSTEALATSAYGPVFLLDSISQNYFVTGHVQVCNTCIASVAVIVKLDTVSYQTNLLALYDGRYYDLKVFDFDNSEKVFSIEYFAAHNDDSLYGGDNDSEHLQHVYKSKFKYSMGEFVEIEKCEWWIDRE